MPEHREWGDATMAWGAVPQPEESSQLPPAHSHPRWSCWAPPITQMLGPWPCFSLIINFNYMCNKHIQRSKVLPIWPQPSLFPRLLYP